MDYAEGDGPSLIEGPNVSQLDILECTREERRKKLEVRRQKQSRVRKWKDRRFT